MILTPVRAPNANAYAERVIETIRTECLDWSLILGRRHLDRTLRTYAEHYNRGRPHRGLALAIPQAEARDPVPVSPRGVHRRDLLGGLIHEYHGLAAWANLGFRPPRVLVPDCQTNKVSASLTKRVELVYLFIEEDHDRVETTRRAPLVLCGEILEPSRGSTAARAWRRAAHLRHGEKTTR